MAAADSEYDIKDYNGKKWTSTPGETTAGLCVEPEYWIVSAENYQHWTVY